MEFSHPIWSYNTNIYEVNVRQYSPEGTFKAFGKHLPRLKDMGVDVLWFMPITPISVKDRKGTMGSYYAVQDYTGINPEFGSLQDFIELVKYAHHLGFKIIIDWVANHTGNDNIWIKEHPDFFSYDDSGQIIHPPGWEDVTKLNYDNEKMQTWMISAMKFWIDNCNIDGFRCDMAHLVPLKFWLRAKKELQKVRPDMFWLGECEEPTYHEVFDATYTWRWMHATEDFCKGKLALKNLLDLLNEYDQSFPKIALRVYFTSNHDENSWNGTEYEKYGEAAKAFAVFSCTWNGIPVIYSGQELPNLKRLMFFDNDHIDWKEQCELHDFYKTLLHLRKINTALRAADPGVITKIIQTTNDDKILWFKRKNGSDELFVILNFSADKTMFTPVDLANNQNLDGKFVNVFDKTEFDLSENKSMELQPWDYRVYEKEKTL